MNRSMRIAAMTFLVVGTGCGASSNGSSANTAGNEAAVTTATPAPAATDVAPTERVLGPNEVARASLLPILDRGLGSFLGTVAVAPVLERGVFVGFRIRSFAASDARFAGVDLVPGDIVTRINGSPIERPEQALAVFRALEVVSEICVEYLRDGERREIRYAIVD